MSPVKRSEGRVSETEGKVRIPSSQDSLSLLKGLCHEDTGRAVSAVLDQFCAEVITWCLYPKHKRYRYQTNFIRHHLPS